MIKQKKFKSFKVSDIEDIELVIWSVKPKMATDLKTRISEEGGRILLSREGHGVSRRPMLEMLGVVSREMEVIFAICRKQDAEGIIDKLAMEFKFDKPGNGKAFSIAIDGYLGAKGPFVEVV